MAKSSARTQKPARSWRDALDDADVTQSANGESNSQKESVPLHQESAEAHQKALLKLTKGDKDKAKELDRLLQHQISERYVTAVALEQASQMLFDKRQAALPTQEALQRQKDIAATDGVMDEILRRYINGASVSKICREDPTLPTYYTAVCKLNEPEWKERYEAARRHRTDKMGEELTEATEELNRLVAAGASSEMVNAVKLHVNTLQWVMARMNPKGWGDRQTVDLTADVKVKSEADVDAALQALMLKAGVRLNGDSSAGGGSSD